MAKENYTPLLSEVLKKVHNAKTKDKKVSILKEYDCEPLRMVIKSSFDPNIKWVMSEGNVPYEPNEDRRRYRTYCTTQREVRKLYRFIEGGDTTIPQFKKENMFIQMLEGLHSSEAELIVNVKDKRLHQVYKGLSAAVVKEAFDWNDNYTRSA